MPQGQFPAILAGMDYTAALIQSLAPIWAYKGADSAAKLNTTLASDPDLFIPMAANGQYLVVGYLYATGAAIGTGDIQLQFTGGSSFRWTGLGYSTSGTTPPALSPSRSSGAAAFGVNGTTASPILILGNVQNGGSAGNWTLQWAENTTNGTTGTVLKQYSWLAAIRTG